MKTPDFQPRYYRDWSKDRDLVSFNVAVKETDLYIRARREFKNRALETVQRQRALLENYIARHPGFITALEPFPVGDDAPAIVKAMEEAGKKVGVGPMAAVAGAFAEFVGRELLRVTPEVIVENGGDVFIKTARKRLVGVYAGESPYTGKIALQIEPADTPLGICTSSGTVGHSLSFGKADAVIVLSPSASLADATATAIGNIVKEESDIQKALDFARDVDGVMGAAVIMNDKMGVWGKINLIRRD
ncbi:MAG: UPF0280 family protein [Dehalococcoidales bacterium]|nr:UPF0280 family protein [Dehalococcoidales bacterium]